MRLLVIVGLLLFTVLYILGAALIARAWWLSGRPLARPPGEPKRPTAVPQAQRTHAA